MPRYHVHTATTYKVSPNYVPKGMVEGQTYEVESFYGTTARDEKQAAKNALVGFPPETEWAFGHRFIRVTLASPRVAG